MYDQHGNWIPSLSRKGYLIYNDYHRFLLTHGAKKSGKTLSNLHKLCRHAFEIEGAVICFVHKTVKGAKSGAWRDLITYTIPHWLAANIGFKYTVEPRTEPDTKLNWFRIRNAYGGESEFQLHSLEHAKDAEAKFKNTRFSMVYMSEADQFEDRIVFDTLDDQLRIVGKPYHEHQLIADTNPPEDGDRHWIHDLWFKKIGIESAEFSNLFREINFTLDDNPFLDPREVQGLKEKYRHDKHKYGRYVLGQWVRDDTGTIFENYLRPTFHIQGNVDGSDESKWRYIYPGEHCIELFAGWDLGDVNHAAIIGCKRNIGKAASFDIIDELVFIHKKISTARFAELFEQRMDFWEGALKQLYGRDRVVWRHWSDSSAMRYRSAADAHEELIVRQISEGRINLMGVVKGRGSVEQGIDLIKKLFFENRLFISAKCRALIEALQLIKPSDLDSSSRFRHPVDALRYMLVMEAPFDVESRIIPTVAPRVTTVQV